MKMRKGCGGVSPNKIEALETQYDFHLPQDYREFLLTVGGGTAQGIDPTNCIPLEKLHDAVEVGVLYGLDVKTDASDIKYWMSEYGDEIWEHSVLTVSYTHLDVYKRQLPRRPACAGGCAKARHGQIQNYACFCLPQHGGHSAAAVGSL